MKLSRKIPIAVSLVAVAVLVLILGVPRFARRASTPVLADPPLGPSLTVKQAGTTVVDDTHTEDFTSGCTITKSGSTASIACAGSGGTVTSVDCQNGLTCTPDPIVGAGTIEPTYGTSANTVTQGNDARLNPAPSAAGRMVYDTGAAYAAFGACASGTLVHGNGAAAPTCAQVAPATDFAAQSANTVLAGPTSGGAVGPTFRLLVADDIPATAVTPGTYGTITGNNARIPSFTVDQGGRLTFSETLATDITIGSAVCQLAGGSACTMTGSIVVPTTVADSSGDGLKNDIGVGYVGLTTGGVVRFRCAGAICGAPDEGASTTSFSFSGTTGAATSQVANVTTGTTAGITAANPTASTVGVQVQHSPTIVMTGHGWDTDDATNRQTQWFLQTRPIAGATVTSTLALLSAIAPGSATVVAQFMSTGGLVAPTAGPSTTQQHTIPAVTSGTFIVRSTDNVFNNVVVQVFTASGTYTPTSSMVFAIAECVGGGGGGGGGAGSATGASGAGGGGSGGYSLVRLTAAQVGASQTVTIGAGGSAGAAGNNAGGNGGDTSVGTLCVGKGGTGASGAAAGSAGSGGAGGVAGTGDLAAVGNSGGSGFGGSITTVTALSGIGSGSHVGGGAMAIARTAAGCTAGNDGNNYGAGGSGAACLATTDTAAGGAGKAGVVIVTEYVK